MKFGHTLISEEQAAPKELQGRFLQASPPSRVLSASLPASRVWLQPHPVSGSLCCRSHSFLVLCAESLLPTVQTVEEAAEKEAVCGVSRNRLVFR